MSKLTRGNYFGSIEMESAPEESFFKICARNPKCVFALNKVGEIFYWTGKGNFKKILGRSSFTDIDVGVDCTLVGIANKEPFLFDYDSHTFDLIAGGKKCRKIACASKSHIYCVDDIFGHVFRVVGKDLSQCTFHQQKLGTADDITVNSKGYLYMLSGNVVYVLTTNASWRQINYKVNIETSVKFIEMDERDALHGTSDLDLFGRVAFFRFNWKKCEWQHDQYLNGQDFSTTTSVTFCGQNQFWTISKKYDGNKADVLVEYWYHKNESPATPHKWDSLKEEVERFENLKKEVEKWRKKKKKINFMIRLKNESPQDIANTNDPTKKSKKKSIVAPPTPKLITIDSKKKTPQKIPSSEESDEEIFESEEEEEESEEEKESETPTPIPPPAAQDDSSDSEDPSQLPSPPPNPLAATLLSERTARRVEMAQMTQKLSLLRKQNLEFRSRLHTSEARVQSLSSSLERTESSNTRLSRKIEMQSEELLKKRRRLKSQRQKYLGAQERCEKLREEVGRLKKEQERSPISERMYRMLRGEFRLPESRGKLRKLKGEVRKEGKIWNDKFEKCVERIDGKLSAMEEETENCIICLERERGIVFLPCGHVICCETCAEQVQLCPNCRKQIQKRTRIFM